MIPIPEWPDMVYAHERYMCVIGGETCNVLAKVDNDSAARHARNAFKNYADRKAFWADHAGMDDMEISQLYLKMNRDKRKAGG